MHQRAFWWAIASGLSWIAFQVSLASPAGRAHTQAAPTASVVNVVRSFEGAAGPGYKDHPDAAGAVGPNHVVDFVGSGMVVRDKKTGAVIQQVSQTQFWQDAGVSPGDLNDPRLIYDPLSGRWFAVNAGPYAFLAVSADSDPTHPWKAVTLTTAVSGDVTPKPAADANGVYVCMYGGNFNTICVALPKSDLLWSGTNAPSLAHEAVFTDLPFEAMPAMDPNPEKAATAPELLLTRLGTQNEVGVPMILLLNKITWTGSTARISATQSIPTPFTYTVPGNAAQPGGTLVKGREDHRFLNLFAAGTSVFGLIGTAVGSRVGADWFEVDAATGRLVQSGTLADPDFDVLFPTIAVDAAGNLGIGFTRTSATEYPSVSVAARLATDPPNTLRAPVLVASGTAAYACNNVNPVGWGTYSLTVRDPSDPAILWTYQEYANSTTPCQWTTRWAAFTLGAAVE